MSGFLSICSSACLSVSSSARLSASLSIYLSAFLPACLPEFLPVCPPSYLPACLPSCMSVCLPACLPSCLPSFLPACFSLCHLSNFTFILFFIQGIPGCNRPEELLPPECTQGPPSYGCALQRQPLPAPQVLCPFLRCGPCVLALYSFQLALTITPCFQGNADGDSS